MNMYCICILYILIIVFLFILKILKVMHFYESNKISHIFFILFNMKT